MKKNFLLAMISIFVLAITSCIGIQGGSEQGQSEPTLGQQLIDLKKAKDEEAITTEEYKALKKKLVFYYE